MSDFNTHGGYFSPDNYFRVDTGGSHEENPNGGVQVGVDEQGVPNMLEEGEPVYNDFVYSDNIRADKEMIEKHNLPTKYIGKLYSEIADDFVDEAEERPNDPISNSGLNAMLVRLAEAQEEQKQIAEQKEIEDELANLSPEELAELEAMMSQPEQTQEPVAPEQAMMGQGAPGTMPYAYGGRVNKFTGGGDTSLGEVMKVDENGELIDEIEPAVVTAESGVVNPFTPPRVIIPVSPTPQVATQSIYEKNLEREREKSSDLTDLLFAQALLSGKNNNNYLPLLFSFRYRNSKATGGPVNKFVDGGTWDEYDPNSMTPEEYARIHGLTLPDNGGSSSMTPEEIKRITGRSIIKDVPKSLFDVNLKPFNPEDYYDPNVTQSSVPPDPGDLLENSGRIFSGRIIERLPAEWFDVGSSKSNENEAYNPSGIGSVAANAPLNNSVVDGQQYDPSSMTPEEYIRIYGLPLPAEGSTSNMTREEVERITGRSLPRDVTVPNVEVKPFDFNQTLRMGFVQPATVISTKGALKGAPVMPDVTESTIDRTRYDAMQRAARLNAETQANAEEQDQRAAVRPTWPMYAGAIGNGLMALQTAFTPADRYTLPRYNPALPYGELSLQREVYNPVDQNMLTQSILANNAAAYRSLRNSGVGPSTTASIVAADNNATRNLGQGFLQTWDANNQRRNAVIAANNQATGQESQFDYGVNQARTNILNDAAMRNIQNDLLLQRLNNQAESEKYAALSQNLNAGLTDLSNIGRTNFAANQVNSNTALYWDTLPDGAVVYRRKCGGFIKPIKKK